VRRQKLKGPRNRVQEARDELLKIEQLEAQVAAADKEAMSDMAAAIQADVKFVADFVDRQAALLEKLAASAEEMQRKLEAKAESAGARDGGEQSTAAAAGTGAAAVAAALKAGAGATAALDADGAGGAATSPPEGDGAGGVGNGEQATQQRMQTEEEKQLSSLITDATAEGRTRSRARPREEAVEAPEGAGPGTPVVAQTARDKEIRELVLKAERFRHGINGSKVDYGRALEAYSAAAQLGSFEATALLGEMYKHGLGVKRDLGKAAGLFDKAADAGDPVGQRNRALLLATGVGVEENQALAVLNLHFAAVGGDYLAQLALGYRHMYGINVPKNCQAAVEYYKPAVDVVVHDAQQFRPPPMLERYSLAPDGSKPRPEELDEDVVDYYQYSAARGDAAAQVALGQLYYFGARGMEQSYGNALKWYLLAAEVLVWCPTQEALHSFT
jgi:TPR repeat protein